MFTFRALWSRWCLNWNGWWSLLVRQYLSISSGVVCQWSPVSFDKVIKVLECIYTDLALLTVVTFLIVPDYSLDEDLNKRTSSFLWLINRIRTFSGEKDGKKTFIFLILKMSRKIQILSGKYFGTFSSSFIIERLISFHELHIDTQEIK